MKTKTKITPEEVVQEPKKESVIIRGQKIALTPLNKFALFLQNKSVLPLAVGVIVADIVKQLITALVDGIIRPFLGLFVPGQGGFEPLNMRIGNVVFKFGDLISVIIQAFIIFLVLYFFIGVILRKEDVLGTTEKAKEEKK